MHGRGVGANSFAARNTVGMAVGVERRRCVQRVALSERTKMGGEMEGRKESEMAGKEKERSMVGGGCSMAEEGWS